MYRAVVFFDLDGTLLNSQKRVTSNSLKAIHRLKEKQILPVIATGRNLLMVKSIMKITGISTVISANGSYILYQNHQLNMVPIPLTVIQRLVKISKLLDNPLAFQSRDQIILNSTDDLTKVAYAHHSVSPQVLPQFYKNNPINFINLFTIHHDKYYQRIFHGKLNIVRNSDKCLDVMKSGINKQFGIRILLEKLQLTNIPTYAFGDGLNDIEMFKEVKYPIAMQNGYSQCKAHAAFITASNDQNGITKGLRHFRLI